MRDLRKRVLEIIIGSDRKSYSRRSKKDIS
jgi:hypothetical protein